jgi:hypothetical protein
VSLFHAPYKLVPSERLCFRRLGICRESRGWCCADGFAVGGLAYLASYWMRPSGMGKNNEHLKMPYDVIGMPGVENVKNWV